MSEAEKSEDNSGLMVKNHHSVERLSNEIYANICFISATHPLMPESRGLEDRAWTIIHSFWSYILENEGRWTLHLERLLCNVNAHKLLGEGHNWFYISDTQIIPDQLWKISG